MSHTGTRGRTTRRSLTQAARTWPRLGRGFSAAWPRVSKPTGRGPEHMGGDPTVSELCHTGGQAGLTKTPAAVLTLTHSRHHSAPRSLGCKAGSARNLQDSPALDHSALWVWGLGRTASPRGKSTPHNARGESAA